MCLSGVTFYGSMAVVASFIHERWISMPLLYLGASVGMYILSLSRARSFTGSLTRDIRIDTSRSNIWRAHSLQRHPIRCTTSAPELLIVAQHFSLCPMMHS